MAQWYEEQQDVATKVLDEMEVLRDAATNRFERWDVNEVLMQEGQQSSDFVVGRTASLAPGHYRQSYGWMDGKLRYNVIRPIVDAQLARLATSRPKCRYQTYGARYTERKRARMLTKYVKGIFAQSSTYTNSQQVFRDCGTYGIGYMKPYVAGGRVQVERVHPRSVMISEPDYGVPASWMQCEVVSRTELERAYPEKSDVIAKAASADEGSVSRHLGYSAREYMARDQDQVLVVEAWYAPRDAKGRHVVVCDGGVLTDEDWRSQYPGLVSFRMFEPAFRFVGLGVVDMLKEIQKEINYLLRKVQEHMNLGGTVKIFVDSASKISIEKLSNENLQIIKYTSVGGSPVQVVQIPAVDRVYFEQIDRLEQKAYNLAGISELFAAAQKPAGLESGRALAQFEDIQSARFLHVGQKWQQFFMDLADACCDLSRESRVRAKMNDWDTLVGDDFNVRTGRYQMAVQAVAQLPDTPAGIIQTVSDYSQTDPGMAADLVMLVDDLDLESYLERMLAPKMLVQMYVDEMLYDHVPHASDDTMDLQYCVKEGALAVQTARLHGDEEAANVLLDFVAAAQGLLAPPAPAAVPGAEPAMGDMAAMVGGAAGMGAPAAGGPAPELPMGGLGIEEAILAQQAMPGMGA